MMPKVSAKGHLRSEGPAVLSVEAPDGEHGDALLTICSEPRKVRESICRQKSERK